VYNQSEKVCYFEKKSITLLNHTWYSEGYASKLLMVCSAISSSYCMLFG